MSHYPNVFLIMKRELTEKELLRIGECLGLEGRQSIETWELNDEEKMYDYIINLKPRPWLTTKAMAAYIAGIIAEHCGVKPIHLVLSIKDHPEHARGFWPQTQWVLDTETGINDWIENDPDGEKDHYEWGVKEGLYPAETQ